MFNAFFSRLSSHGSDHKSVPALLQYCRLQYRILFVMTAGNVCIRQWFFVAGVLEVGEEDV